MLVEYVEVLAAGFVVAIEEQPSQMPAGEVPVFLERQGRKHRQVAVA